MLHRLSPLCAMVCAALLIGCSGGAGQGPLEAEASSSSGAEAGSGAGSAAPPIEPPSGARRLRSGLALLRVAGGSGRDGTMETQRVQVRYRAWDASGQRIDGGGHEGAETRWLVMALGPGLSEALSLIQEGQTWRAWVPSALTREQAGDRVYEIEHLGVIRRSPPVTPPDVAAPPPEAERTETGLASRVIEAGTGTRHPDRTSRVTVHYTGWTTDGQRFDSSVTRGLEMTFPLDGVIRGWTEGIPLMVEGEIRRFWIPAELAYGETPNRPGAPAGMLVFDVELMAFE